MAAVDYSLAKEMLPLIEARIREMDEQERKAEHAAGSLREYCKQAWHVVEPASPLVWGWSDDAVCDHLEAVTKGHIRNLIVTIPPRTMKSLKVAVFWPSWAWISKPELRWIFASYAAHLSIRDSVKCRRVIQSEWYQQRWGNRYKLTGDQNAKEKYENSKTGHRLSTSVGGVGTGEGGDVIVADDPHNAAKAESDTIRESVIEWWKGAMSTRGNNPKTVAKVIVQQRVHERDLAGVALADGGYVHLCLPMRFESARRCITVVGERTWVDPREKDGDLLAPDRFGDPEVTQLENELGPYRASGQLQQRPSPSEGGIFKKWWWKYWKPVGSELPPVQITNEKGEIEYVEAIELPDVGEDFQSWDCSFKKTQDADFVCGGAWRKRGANFFLLAMDMRRMGFPETCDAIRAMSQAYPSTIAKFVEDKANGSAVIAHLASEVAGLIPVNPLDGKEARANAVAPIARSGNVYLPHPGLYSWASNLIESLAVFPNGAHDDDVDMFTQALANVKQGVYVTNKGDIQVSPFPVQRGIARSCAIFIGPLATGAVWAFQDPTTGRVFIYDEYFRTGTDWMLHAAEIKRRTGNVPVILDAARAGDREMYARQYRTQGMRVIDGAHDVEPALAEVNAALSSGGLKVFSTCSRWFEEAVLMSRSPTTSRLERPEEWVVQGATRVMWRHKARMVEPSATKAPYVERDLGERGWMG